MTTDPAEIAASLTWNQHALLRVFEDGAARWPLLDETLTARELIDLGLFFHIHQGAERIVCRITPLGRSVAAAIRERGA